MCSKTEELFVSSYMCTACRGDESTLFDCHKFRLRCFHYSGESMSASLTWSHSANSFSSFSKIIYIVHWCFRLNRKSSAKVQERARPTSGSSSISRSCSPVTGRWTVVCVRVVAQAPDQTCEVKKQLNHRFTTVPMFHLCLWTSGSDRKDKDTDTSGWNVCLRSCQAQTRGGAFKFFTSFIS